MYPLWVRGCCLAFPQESTGSLHSVSKENIEKNTAWTSKLLIDGNYYSGESLSEETDKYNKPLDYNQPPLKTLDKIQHKSSQIVILQNAGFQPGTKEYF